MEARHIRKLILIIIISFALLPNMCLFTTTSAQSQALGVDMDNAGNHIIRDDDGTKEFDYDLTQNGYVLKKLWTYFNNMEDADSLRLWIYGKLYDPAPDEITHDIYINSIYISSFKAREYFVPGYFTWGSILLEPTDVIPGACNDILIRSVSTTTLAIGVDRTFTTLGGENVKDFDRSQTHNTFVDTFTGEFMIYLEFIAVDGTLSIGYTYENTQEYIELKEFDASGSDVSGIVLDWSTMSAADFNKIFLVRVWVYCIPAGTMDLTTTGDIAVQVNGQNVETFNPYKRLPRTWSWLITDVYNRGDGGKLNLGAQVNHIDIRAIDGDPTDNNLRISKVFESVPDDDLTWWYIRTGPYTHEGSFQNPSHNDCTPELAIYIQVFQSDFLRASAYKPFGYGLSYIENTRDGYYTGYGFDSQYPLSALSGLTLGPLWGPSYTESTRTTQWTFYGEERSNTDVNAGDLKDIYLHYGPGHTETAVLYEVRHIGDTLYVSQDNFHDNDDSNAFTSLGTTLTEAEGSDYGYLRGEVEDDGSNGYNNDMEWIFFMVPHMFNNGQGCRMQTLLWHNAHAVFGFQEVSVVNLNAITEDMDWYLERNSVINAFDANCDDNGVTGYYFYNTDTDHDWVWDYGPGGGIPPGAEPDSIDRSKIAYANTG